MHQLHRFSSTTVRSLSVAVISTASALVFTSPSFGDVPQVGATVGGSMVVTTIGGMTIATFAWAVAGVVFLTVGLIAASKSGRRVATTSALAVQSVVAGSPATESSDRNQAALAG